MISQKAVNPSLIIIFYKELLKYKIKFEIIDNTVQIVFPVTFQVAHPNQICESFKVHMALLFDNTINSLITSEELSNRYNFLSLIRKRSHLNVSVEEKFENRHVDMVYDLGSGIKLLIEINEGEHNKIKDRYRQAEIFCKSEQLIILFYIEEETIDELIRRIKDELVRCLYRIDSSLGYIFHLLHKKIIVDVSTCIRFTSIREYKEQGKMTVDLLSNILKSFGVIGSLHFLERLVSEGELRSNFFTPFLI